MLDHRAQALIKGDVPSSHRLVVLALAFDFLAPEEFHNAEPVLRGQRNRRKSKFAHRGAHIPAHPCVRLAPSPIGRSFEAICASERINEAFMPQKLSQRAVFDHALMPVTVMRGPKEE